jgi:hypothetical protein
VAVTLRGLEAVARVSILNTQNAYTLDRASGLLRVDLLARGRLVASRERTAERYPHWTEFEFGGTTKADAIQITVVTTLGKGGGLNEIKIFRK